MPPSGEAVSDTAVPSSSGRSRGPERHAPTIMVVLTPSADPHASGAATGLEVRPFRALTYRQRDPEHLARVSSPAYDLVTPAGRDRLADADPYNIVRLILPRVDRSESDPGPNAVLRSAEQAAASLRAWEAEGILDRDVAPAVWLYELTPPGGAPPTVGWLGAVALPPPGSAAVLPHEDTYPVAVEGRRALLAATRTDLEPIVLAHDPDPLVAELTVTARHGEPTLAVQDTDGVAHRLWRITDPVVLARLTAALRETGAVIADGHHRFAAAAAHARSRPSLSGADAVLALVTPMGPGGLRVAPIHRVVPELDMEDALTRAARGFRVTELPTPTGPAAVETAVQRWVDTEDENGFLLTDGVRLVSLTAATADVTATVPQEAPAA